MNQQVLAYLPVISPIVTLLVVMLGMLWQNLHVDARVADVNRLVEATEKTITAELKLHIQRVEARVNSLEKPSCLTYRS